MQLKNKCICKRNEFKEIIKLKNWLTSDDGIELARIEVGGNLQRCDSHLAEVSHLE